jgi:pyrimidine operon attenuation protein/uracil phosphoribosyltransferase
LGFLDITFYRDDFRRGDKTLKANKTDINFIVDDKRVVLIDDVLFTGRSIRAALTAIQSFGRPMEVELLTLIDRRFSRHLPIQPDYRGRQVDVINEEKVQVLWEEEDGKDIVYLVN